MGKVKTTIVCIIDNKTPSKLYKSLEDSLQYYVDRVFYPYQLLDYINDQPRYKIEYYVISTKYCKAESFKEALATIKDKHIIWIV